MIHKLLQKTRLSRSEKSQSLLILASIAKDTRHYAEALILLQTWRSNFPSAVEMPRVNLAMGRIYREIQAYDRAKEYFYLTLSSLVVVTSRSNKTTLKQDQRFAQVATWELAETEYQSGNWDRAFGLFERFKQQNPDSEDLVQASVYRQADCRYQTGKLNDAMKFYQTALAIGPFHPFAPEAWLRLIDIYGRQSNFKLQAEALEAFIWLVKETFPEDTTYWQQRCAGILLLFVQSRPKEAQQLLEAIRQRQPDANWDNITDFLQKLTERMMVQKSSTPSLKNDSDWVEWQRKITQENLRIQQNIEVLVR